MISSQCYVMRFLYIQLVLLCVSLEVSAIVRPENFGAKGDIVTNDTQAFEKAIATGEDVLIEGTYKIDAISLKPYQSLIGKPGCRLLYNHILVAEGCHLKGIVLDGQWNTKGVAVLGSNVLIDGCSFLNTKGTLAYYGGETCSLRIGKYQDLEEKRPLYHDITIKDSSFDGCEPYDKVSNVSVNKTVARSILSYGCKNLQIIGCTFKNLEGYYDADFIQIRSFGLKNENFPFYDINEQWTGQSQPFHSFCYAPARTKIVNCFFYQSDCKSSIKIMASNVVVENNTFIVDNKNEDMTYSIVRSYVVSNVEISNNKIHLLKGNLDSVFKIGHNEDATFSDNDISARDDFNLLSIAEMIYSKRCRLIRNVIKVGSLSGLFASEFNRSISICDNSFVLSKSSKDNLRMFVPSSNHYSYPSKIIGKINFNNNQLIIPTTNDVTIDLSNKYDYPIFGGKNKVKTNNKKSKIQIK